MRQITFSILRGKRLRACERTHACVKPADDLFIRLRINSINLVTVCYSTTSTQETLVFNDAFKSSVVFIVGIFACIGNTAFFDLLLFTNQLIVCKLCGR